MFSAEPPRRCLWISGQMLLYLGFVTSSPLASSSARAPHKSHFSFSAGSMCPYLVLGTRWIRDCSSSSRWQPAVSARRGDLINLPASRPSRVVQRSPPTTNMRAILPPSPAPSPGRLYPERAYGALPPSKNTMPPPMHSPPSREAERENIIRQGEAFCQKYPDDKVCHRLTPDAPPPL
jgi:hypothetical protein